MRPECDATPRSGHIVHGSPIINPGLYFRKRNAPKTGLRAPEPGADPESSHRKNRM